METGIKRNLDDHTEDIEYKRRRIFEKLSEDENILKRKSTLTV